MSENTPKLIGLSLVASGRKPAWLTRQFCSATQCPFRDRGECISCSWRQISCPHGSVDSAATATPRAKRYADQIRAFQAEVAAGPSACNPVKYPGLARVGDYVYIPNMPDPGTAGAPCGAPWPFVHDEEFTPELVSRICAVSGTRYFAAQLSVFLFQLSKLMPDIYAKTVSMFPAVQDRTLSTRNLPPLTSTLTYVPAGEIGFGLQNSMEDVVVSWDGTTLVVNTNKDVGYNHYGTKYVIQYVPDQARTFVVVTDPELIYKIVEKHPNLLTKEHGLAVLERVAMLDSIART